MPKPVLLDTNAVIHFVQALDMPKFRVVAILQDGLVSEPNAVTFGLNLYLLAGYAKVKGHPVLTFDTVLKKQLAEQAFTP